MSGNAKRLYQALNVGLFIFVDDEFMFNKTSEAKAQVLLDFVRMDIGDQEKLLSEIPDEELGKNDLQAFAKDGESWVSETDWKALPLDDISYALESHPNAKKMYENIPESLWKQELQDKFLHYGAGLVIQTIFESMFKDIIRVSPRYLSTRIYNTYTEEIRQEILNDLVECDKKGKSAVLILDNKVGNERLARQMIDDLKKATENVNCPIYTTFFSTASKENDEDCTSSKLYIGYATKAEKLAGVHKNIFKAAINLLIRNYKTKYTNIIGEKLDTLAESPDLVEYLYGMARAEGEPGYDVLQQWVSLMVNSDMEQSDELIELMKLSSGLDSYEADVNWDLQVPEKLINAAYSENFMPMVNRFCSATAPGDIFEIDNKLYVLVGQDCDYMMGETRNRNSPICELVPAELVPQGHVDKLENDEKYVYINNFIKDGTTYVLKVNYGRRYVISNEIVNLCSFNQEGICKINCNHDLPDKIVMLLQPYMTEYYKKLQEYFRSVREIKQSHIEFFDLAKQLKTTLPLIGVSDYKEESDTLIFNMNRISRLKKTASLYLYKMFLEYRGRMPYTSINLTGYSIVDVLVNGAEHVPAYVKLTNSRKKNSTSTSVPKLAWYLHREKMEEIVNKLINQEFQFPDNMLTDNYIALGNGTAIAKVPCGDRDIELKKVFKDSNYFLEIKKY